MTAKLIVFEGLDSSGKATQTRLLVKRLKQHNIPAETIDFPQYGTWSASFVEKYLNGAFGEHVDPYQAALFYALDRYAHLQTLKKWRAEGKVIIANRYVPANQAYQGGKIKDEGRRKEFLNWLDNIEYTLLGLPRPDLVLYLYAPLKESQALLEKRRKKDYIKDGNKDIHEKNEQLLESTQKVYNILAQQEHWHTIQCAEETLLSKNQIHEKVWNIVKETV